MKHYIWRDLELISPADRKPMVDAILSEYPCLSEREALAMVGERIANAIYAESKRMDIPLRERILCIADLGTKHGDYHGHRELGKNLADVFAVLSGTPLAALWVDSHGNLRGCGIHKDGRNHYTFRMWRDGVPNRAKTALKAKIVEGAETKADINQLTTRLGDIVGRLYGFAIPGKPNN